MQGLGSGLLPTKGISPLNPTLFLSLIFLYSSAAPLPQVGSLFGLSVGFPRQEYWSGLPFLLQEIFPIKDRTRVSRIGRQVLYHCKSKPDGASGKEPTYNAGDIRSGLDGVATVENYLEVSQKTKNRIMIYPAICTPEYISKKENEKYDLKKIHTPQHS